MRLVTGWNGDMKEVTSIRAEKKNGVPSSFLGFSVLQFPKVLRYLFFLDMEVSVWEADLVASHLREFLELARVANVECAALADYVDTPESVKKFREDEALAAGVEPADVKQLMNVRWKVMGSFFCQMCPVIVRGTPMEY